MKSLTLHLGRVYSRLADEADTQGLDLTKLPEQWRSRLRRHQAQTWQAYQNSDAQVIFDTALTGDGKSLAGQLPMLVDDCFALLLYPTNELIRDQVKQVERYLADFGRNRPHQVVYSERITEEVEKYDGALSRSSALINWLKNRDYILSNPDLFHLMSSYNYGSEQAKREFVYQIPANFQYLLFDEFHIFGPPQVVSVVNIMNYHKVAFPHSPLKYVFLSATPSRNFRTLLERSGFQMKVVEGSYSSVPADGYTAEPIVQPVALHLHSLTDGGAYAWAEEHLEEVKDFFLSSTEKAKGVFIVNSVATAKRLVAYYRRELQDKGIIRVGENTRLTDPKERLEAMENPDVRLIIATSTIDVGVDFKINLLIFESTGSGTFIQRLGRLGRHPGWSEYRAYALLPDWTVDRFASHFVDGTEIDRVKFLAKVREQEEYSIVKESEETIKPIFQPDQEYRHYTGCWGGLQTAHIVLSTEKISKQWNSEFVQELRQQYNRVYSRSEKKDWIKSQMGRYRGIENDELDSLILQELNTFRGRSPLDCGIFDETDDCFKTYNLFFLLANTVFEPIPEARFKKMLAERGQQFERYRSRDLKLYVILKQYIDEREQFSLSCSYSFKGKLNQVHVYDTFTIRDSRTLANHLDDSVNDRLRELELICLVAQGNPREFKRQNGLNPLSPVYQVRGIDGMERSIVFGLDAFLAHSLVYWKAHKDDDGEMYIC